MFFGVALRNVGVEELLNGIIQYCPSPIRDPLLTDVQQSSKSKRVTVSTTYLLCVLLPVPLVMSLSDTTRSAFECGKHLDGRRSFLAHAALLDCDTKPVTLPRASLATRTTTVKSDSPFAQQIGFNVVECKTDVAPTALVYKVLPDSIHSKSAFIRVYSGRLASGSVFFNATTAVWERVQAVYRIKADRYLALKELVAGRRKESIVLCWFTFLVWTKAIREWCVG